MQRQCSLCMQMLTTMRLEASWEQGSAAASYCTTTHALCQALQAASHAAPPHIATHPQFVPLATDALLGALALSSSIHPAGMQIPGSGHAHTHRNEDSQGWGAPQGEGGCQEERHKQVVLPPGCSAQGVQQLQAGLEAVCHASRQLLSSCSGVLLMQMATAVMLAVLSIVQCAPSGALRCCQDWSLVVLIAGGLTSGLFAGLKECDELKTMSCHSMMTAEWSSWSSCSHNRYGVLEPCNAVWCFAWALFWSLQYAAQWLACSIGSDAGRRHQKDQFAEHSLCNCLCFLCPFNSPLSVFSSNHVSGTIPAAMPCR